MTIYTLSSTEAEGTRSTLYQLWLTTGSLDNH